jgi:peptidoglycan hydrolase CwlO-like protein
MKKIRTNIGFKLLCSALLLAGIFSVLPSPSAQANYFSDLYNGMQKFSELPGEVNKLQESYRQTVEDLEQAKNELDAAKDQLGATAAEMETYRTQNAALQEQNRQLTQMVDELRNDRQARENSFNRIKVTVITGLALILGYFLLIRLIRLGMRSRSRRSDRLR